VVAASSGSASNDTGWRSVCHSRGSCHCRRPSRAASRAQSTNSTWSRPRLSSSALIRPTITSALSGVWLLPLS
jgi:hypothetical protein